MLRKMMLLMIAISVCSFSNCDAKLQSSLLGCWTDSVEENSSEIEGGVFRPCNYKTFPPSRFRFGMKLEKHGNCTWLQLAPNDAHYMAPGKWAFNSENQVLKIRDSLGKVVRKFQVLEIKKDQLRLLELN